MIISTVRLYLGFIIISLALCSCSTNPQHYTPYPNYGGQGQVFGALGGAAIGTIYNSSVPLFSFYGMSLGRVFGNEAETTYALRYRLRHNHKVQVIQQGEYVRLVLDSDRIFDIDSEHFKPREYFTLLNIIKLIKFYDNTPIYISAFTDNIGSPKHNKELSEKQANAIAGYLWAHGIDHQRIHSKGYGSNPTVASDMSSETRAMNRRVYIDFRKA